MRHFARHLKRAFWIPAAAAGAILMVALALLSGAAPAIAAPVNPGVTMAPGDRLMPLRAALVAAHQTLIAPARYTVAAGQSLSTISASLCGTAADWTGIYAASRAAGLTAWNANDLVTGQQLAIQCYANPGMADRAPLPPPPPPPPAPVVQAVAYQAPAAPVQTYQQPAAAPVESTTAYSGGGGFQSCVIAAESGGNSQVMNSSGHYGLYQFSESTWEEYGGSAGSFGDASVAQQNAVFDNAMAQGGESNWSPYDGC